MSVRVNVKQKSVRVRLCEYSHPHNTHSQYQKSKDEDPGFNRWVTTTVFKYSDLRGVWLVQDTQEMNNQSHQQYE